MEHNAMRREKRWFFVGGAAVVLAIALAASFVIWLTPSTAASYQPTYPQETSFEDSEARMERHRIADGLEPALIDTLRSFGAETSSLLLSEENTLYSPVSLYLTLALCAETANGVTRNEIITALQQLETSDLREAVPRLFQALSFHNEVGQLRLASSLWLNNRLTFHEDSLRVLADYYYTYSFEVDFGDHRTSSSIADWVNKNTAGKLKRSSEDFLLEPTETTLLLNTVYFRDEWLHPFSEEQSVFEMFYPSKGVPVEAEFMKALQLTGYTSGDGYTMASLPFKNRAEMVFVLPEEGSSPQILLKNTALMAEILSGGLDEQTETVEVEWAIPKFSFSTSLEMNDALSAMGVQSAFHPADADFSPLTEEKMWISTVRQNSAISIDEKGCEAAAYTEVLMNSALQIAPKRREMRLDRPFLFLIVDNGIPLFIGTMGNPSL